MSETRLRGALIAESRKTGIHNTYSPVNKS